MELTARALKEGCQSPIILLTGQDDVETDVRAASAGASDYLVKGGTDAALLDGLEAWLVTRLGKSIVRAKDTPNFVANRVGIAGMMATMIEAEKFGLSVKDLHSGMIAVYPVTEKDAASTIESLRHFAGRRKIHNIYSDNALELAASARSLGIEHHTSLPGEPKTNSIIERTNQIIVGGTTASLIAAGLPPC